MTGLRLFGLLVCAAGLLTRPAVPLTGLPPGVHYQPGPVNRVVIGDKLAIYGCGVVPERPPRWVLFTHARRDLLRASRWLLDHGGIAVIPAGEAEWFVQPELFWVRWESARFHDYSQMSTRVPYWPVRKWQAVRGGELLDFDGVRVEVLDTPGLTPHAVSYLIELDGRRLAFTGDLIYGHGQMLELYSLQGPIPELNVRGYHGYLARAAELIGSLEAVLERKPDVVVPAHGPIIEDPQAAVQTLIKRLRELLRSHFRTDALRWYWGEENYRRRAGRVLRGEILDPMPMAEQRALPDWILAVENSRLLLSRSGAAFLIDAGNRRIEDELDRLIAAGRIRALEGIWITHYHDDHTEHVSRLAARFRCPIYFIEQMRDVLAHPGRYHLPCLTLNSIRGRAVRDGERWRWCEFELRADFFPGQTLYHGGLLARRDDGQTVYFLGDSFTPSGVDDYCMQNRNLFYDELGYGRCFRILGTLAPQTWLINQHVEPMFHFSREQLELMRTEFEHRRRVVTELGPWPDPDYAVDETWVRIYPYACDVTQGSELTLEARILNHSPHPERFVVHWNVPEGWKLVESSGPLIVLPKMEGAARARVRAATAGLHLVTVDITFGGRTFWEWTEALVRVK